MRPLTVYYCDQFVLPLPPQHRFPMVKYARLRERVEAANRGQFALYEPPAASDAEILQAHEAAYLERVLKGELSLREQRVLGFPWSSQLVERSRRSSGATLAACRAALQEGVAVNLAGGTHHAYANQAQGFCVFNDAAIAARVMLAEERLGHIAIVDADVHQGNGTAAILAQEPRAFTLSIHGGKNFPFQKERSDLDIELADGVADEAYLEALQSGLECALAKAELVIYLAGADPYSGDRLGRLSLTKEGLSRRDQMVFDQCRQRAIPVAVAMAGGYADNIDDIVDIHFNTVQLAAIYRYENPSRSDRAEPGQELAQGSVR